MKFDAKCHPYPYTDPDGIKFYHFFLFFLLCRMRMSNVV